MTPTRNNILLKVKKKELKSGIVMPDDAKDQDEFAIYKKGPEVSKQFKEGDKVYFKPQAQLSKIKTDKEEYIICEEDDIIAIDK
jgi:co-chaperonin GroES (HSP10)